MNKMTNFQFYQLTMSTLYTHHHFLFTHKYTSYVFIRRTYVPKKLIKGSLYNLHNMNFFFENTFMKLMTLYESSNHAN